MVEDVSALVAELRLAGGDCTAIEVKAAAGGLGDSLISTLSAFANLPGGGLIILGLDERNGFTAVQLDNPQVLKQGVAAKARNLAPPVQVEISDGTADGKPVILVRVGECDPSGKPCRINAGGPAYLRGYDGDYRLSVIEEQGFLAARKPPRFDCQPVHGSRPDHLDDGLLHSFLSLVRERDGRGLGRYANDTELLIRAGVLTEEEIPTVAGMLALGGYPQQWFPRYVIQAAAEPLASDPADTRARNQVMIAGPIPHMLDQAMDWARATFGRTIVSNPDGTVRDRYDYPLLAFRELIANALLHRDLDHWSQSMAVEVRLRWDRLVISNPGGLYGITLDRLGREAVTSARNARLVSICQYVTSSGRGARVVEALAEGIRIVADQLSAAHLPSARYADAGIRFAAVLHQPPLPPQPGIKLSPAQERVYALLVVPHLTVADLAQRAKLAPGTTRKALRALRTAGLVDQVGGPGRVTTYSRSDFP
jgi:ATP-dependent DNA helicase RecG